MKEVYKQNNKKCVNHELRNWAKRSRIEDKILNDRLEDRCCPESPGRQLWVIKVSEQVTKKGEIIVHADRPEVLPSGDLVMWTRHRGYENDSPSFIFARGQWEHVVFTSHADCGNNLAEAFRWPEREVPNWKVEVIKERS